MRRTHAALLACALVATALPAWADEPAPPTASSQAAAERLFDEGVRLLQEGRFPEACAKLEQSERLDPSAGTLLNLGDCYEQSGRTASAWATFRAAARASVARKRPDWERIALRHAEALEPKLSWLTVVVEHAPPDATVDVDGVPLGRSAWATAIPMDPGWRTVTATAPGHAPWTGKALVGGAGERATVTVPALERTPDAPPATLTAVPAGSTTTSSPFWTPHRVLGLGVLGLGVVAGSVSVGLAVLAADHRSQVVGICPAYPICPATLPADERARAMGLNGDAKTFADAATVTAIAAAATAVVGATLLLTAHSSTRTVEVRPMASGDRWGALLQGTF
jgi:serine/threonine-protein kinase